MSKPKFSTELKIRACEDFLSGKYSHAQVCEKYGITYNEKNHSSSSLNEWAPSIEPWADAFTNSHHNKSYSSELKIPAVEEYLAGKGSIMFCDTGEWHPGSIILTIPQCIGVQ